MNTRYLTALILTGMTSICHPAPPTAATQLHGKWDVVSFPAGWKKLPGTHVMVSGNEITVLVGAIPATKFRYHNDGGRGTVDAAMKHKGKPTVRRGVYDISGNTLIVNVAQEGKPRPKDTTAADAERWVLRRAGN